MAAQHSTTTDFSSRYKFNGKELDQKTGCYYGVYPENFGRARYYNPSVSRWLSVDPLADHPNQIGMSPYSAFWNNPIKYTDPDGRCPDCPNDNYTVQEGDNFWNLENQWGLDHGSLVQWNPGVDPTKLQIGQTIKAFGTEDAGQAVYVDNQSQFSTNNTNTGEAPSITVQNFSQSEWNSRPDSDGKLTLGEANEWYRGNSGDPLFVDASKISLMPLSKADIGVGESKYINFASPKNANFGTGLVYGTIKVSRLDAQGTTRLGGSNGLLDNYGFEYHKGRTFRNAATWLGRKVAGEGTSFNIYNYGNAQLRDKPKVNYEFPRGPKY